MGRKMWTAEEIRAALEAGEPQIPQHVARVTGLSRTTIKRWIDTGETFDKKPWRHTTRGNQRLVYAEDVLAFLEESEKVRTGKTSIDE